MRQCLIHAGGVADSDVERKSVSLKWFKRREPILISPEKVDMIIEGLFGFAYGELLHYGKKIWGTVEILIFSFTKNVSKDIGKEVGRVAAPKFLDGAKHPLVCAFLS